MPNLDLTEFIDLALVDQDPQDLFDAALLLMRSTFPDWSPREGNIEVVLLETMAEMVAESIFTINRLPGAITEVLLSMYGIQRDIGEPPVVELKFFMSGVAGYTIPAGTSVTVSVGDDIEPVTFETDTELVIPPGINNGTVWATGTTYTAEANGVEANVLVESNEMLIYTEYIKTNTVVSGGRSEEDDATYLTRGVQRFQRLTDTLVLPKHFTAAAREFEFVKLATTLDNYNPAGDGDNNGPVGNDVGHVTVAVYGDGENVSAPNKVILQSYFDTNSLASLAIHIINPTITSVPVTATVVFEPAADIIEVTGAITEALQEFLSPNNWGWGNLVRRNSIISIISNVPGVDFVQTLTAPASDVTLAGVAPLTTPGTITIVQG
jgi:uncharacterized phage protein gp47/JayE